MSDSLQGMLWEPHTHTKNFWLKPLMAGSSSQADWHYDLDTSKNLFRIDWSEPLNFWQEIKGGSMS